MQIQSPHERLVGMAAEIIERTQAQGATPEQAREQAFSELRVQAPGPDEAPGRSFGWIGAAILLATLTAAAGVALLALAFGAGGLIWLVAIAAVPFLALSAWPAFTSVALRRNDTREIEQAIAEAERRLGSGTRTAPQPA